MKLIIRSQYWGNVLRGKPRVDAANPTRSFRTISSQAVLTIEGKYWGCCQGHGKRVLEMTEQHFIDSYNGEWDLYFVGTASSESEAIHTFFLLPHVQFSIDVGHHVYHNGWQYVATASASSMREKLTEVLKDMFKPNETIGYRYHHVHVEILMEQVVDYASRAKKEKARSEKDETPKENNSIDPNESNTSDDSIPQMEKSYSNDATSTAATSPMTCTSYQEMPKFVPSESFDQEMICYPVPVAFPIVHPMHAQMFQPHPHFPNNFPMHTAAMPMAISHPGLAYVPVQAVNPSLPASKTPSDNNGGSSS